MTIPDKEESVSTAATGDRVRESNADLCEVVRLVDDHRGMALGAAVPTW